MNIMSDLINSKFHKYRESSYQQYLKRKRDQLWYLKRQCEKHNEENIFCTIECKTCNRKFTDISVEDCKDIIETHDGHKLWMTTRVINNKQLNLFSNE